MSKQKEKKSYPEELIIERKRTNLFYFTASQEDTKPVRIHSGVNRFKDQDIIKFIMDHHAYQGLVESGVHVVHSVSPEEQETDDKGVFTSMVVPKAKAVVEKTFSIDALESMHADESSKKGRKQVLDAISDQIKMLQDPSKKDLVK